MDIDNKGGIFPSLYQLAFNELPASYIVVDKELVIIDYTAQLGNELDLPNDIKGKSVLNIFHVQIIEDITGFNALIAESNVFKAELIDDENKPVDSTNIPEPDSLSLTFTSLKGNGYLISLKMVRNESDHLAAFVDFAENPDNEIFKAIINTSQFPFCIVDIDNKVYILRNKAHLELESKLIHSESLENMPFLVDSAVPYKVFLETMRNMMVPFVESHEYTDREGYKHYYEINGFPVVSRKSGKHSVLLYYQDLTNEITSKQEIENYRSILEDLFSNLPGMVFRCLNETNWTIEFASVGCKALTGYSTADLVNNNKIHYGDLIHPDDKQMVWDNIQHAIKRKRHYDLQYRIITKQGKVKWVSEKGKATYDQYDQVVSLGGFITDISEGRLAEINLTKELNTSEAIAQISMELLKDTVTPLHVSRLVQEFVKTLSGSKFSVIYSPDESGNGFTLFNHDNEDETLTVHPDNYTVKQFAFLNRLLESSQPYVLNEETSIILPGFHDDEITINRIISVPAFTNKKLTGLLIIGNADEDYTSETIAISQRFINMFALGLYRLKAEETLQEAKRKAEESDRLKSLFLSNMSHEIRTPMNAIVGFAEMLQDTDLNREQKNRFLEVIIKSGDNLLRLINDIIDISKIEAGQLKFDYSDCLVNEMISDLETYFKQELVRQKKQHLNLYVQLGHPESDFALQTDCTRLKQILNNLIGNAVKFTDEGFIEFGYQIKSGSIEFFVRDSGIGIAADKQKLIFERFGQVQEAISRNLSGTGLGLTISKNLVEMLGGAIWVDSIPGEGSTFFFNLPLRLGARHVSKEKQETGEDAKLAFDLLGKNILIVEDVDTNYFYLSSLLQKMNCKIQRANNGLKAIEIAKKDKSIDLILMDIELPVLDGYKATQEIKKFRPELPIIAQTAFAMMGERERSREAGCNDYIAKPIRKEELISTLRKYV